MKITVSAAVLAVVLLVMPVSAVPYLAIDNPRTGSIVGQNFAIQGAAVGSDVVHVWAFPGGSGAPGVFLGSAWTAQADAQRQLVTGGFSLMVYGAPVGTYPVVAYAHDPVTGGFPSQEVVTLQVRACLAFNVGWPFTGPAGPVTVWMPFCGV